MPALIKFRAGHVSSFSWAVFLIRFTSLEVKMEISTLISNNETLLNGLAAVIVIFGFLGAIGRTLFKGLRDESRKASHSNKITLAELS